MPTVITPENLAERFFDSAEKHPERTALVEPLHWSATQVEAEKIWSFAEFAALVRKFQSQLYAEGYRHGDRILILLPVSARMFALVSAMFANGLTPVFFDHTMEPALFRRALRNAGLKAVFSTRRFFRYRLVLPTLWSLKLYTFSEKGFALYDWNQIPNLAAAYELEPCTPDFTALITFTSGSSGQPKAADRSLEILFQQREISHSLWTRGEFDIEMTVFPMVVFANLVYGVTTVLPAMSLGAPDPDLGRRLSGQILKHQVNRLALTPSSLMAFCTLAENHRLTSVRKLVTGGAPVPKWLIDDALTAFPRADGYVVYGSTEAEPISHANFLEIADAEDSGYLVGQAIPQLDVAIVAASPPTSGEILLRGPHVVSRYLFNDMDNRMTKWRDHNGNIWHRTRDTGYEDSRKRLWLTGRIGDRVQSHGRLNEVYPVEHSLENILRNRVAWIDHRKFGSVIFAQCDPVKTSPQRRRQFERQAANLGIPVQYIEQMPVDPRHFWKINRRRLGAKLAPDQALPRDLVL